MAWIDVQPEQMVSFNDALTGGFVLRDGQTNPGGNKCMTKDNALTTYCLEPTNMSSLANNQLAKKSLWEPKPLLSYSYTLKYSYFDDSPRGFSTSAESCSATTSMTVYSNSNVIAAGLALYKDTCGSVPLDATVWNSGLNVNYYKLDNVSVRFQGPSESIFGNVVYDTTSCATCYTLVEIGRAINSTDACYNANTQSYVIVGADVNTLLGATLLYTRCSNPTPAAAGWYSDGTRARYWNGSAFQGANVVCIA